MSYIIFKGKKSEKYTVINDKEEKEYYVNEDIYEEYHHVHREGCPIFGKQNLSEQDNFKRLGKFSSYRPAVAKANRGRYSPAKYCDRCYDFFDKQ